MKKEIKNISIEGTRVDVEMKRFAFGEAQIKVVDAEQGIVEMYVSKFGNVDSYGDIVLKGAFAKSVERFLKDGRYPKGIWSHDWDKPIAKTLEMVEDNIGLRIKAQFILSVQQAREAFELIKEGVITDYSFGYFVNDSETDRDGHRLLKEVTIFEWSPVLVGANPETETLDVKSADRSIEMKGAVADVLNARDNPDYWSNRERKWRLVARLERIFSAFMTAYLDDRAEVASFSEHLSEMLSIMGSLTEGEKSLLKSVLALELKEGRTISADTRKEIEAALDAMDNAKGSLEALLDEEKIATPESLEGESADGGASESVPDESDAGSDTDEKGSKAVRKLIKALQGHVRTQATAGQAAAKIIKQFKI